MNVSRRVFVQAASAAFAMPAIIPSHVLGQAAPSKKITLGCIGAGTHGMGVNIRNFLSIDDVRIVAVCDALRSRMDGAKKTIDETYKNTDCKAYQDFRQIISDKSIDAVVISTPEHWHITMAMMALEAGKDVFCEKPTKFISEGFALQACMKKHKAVFQTGLEDRSLPHYHKMVEWCRNGAIGDVQRIEVTLPRYQTLPPPAKDVPIPEQLNYNLYTGPSPLIPFQKQFIDPWGWRVVRNFGNGTILDWGAHMFDTAQLCANAHDVVPVEVSGKGMIPTNSLTDVPVEFDVDITYSNGVVVNLKHGGNGIKIYGSKGWVGNDSWNAQLKASDEAILKTKYTPDTSKYQQMPKSEHKNFVACVQSREKTTYPADTMHSIHLGLHAADISIRLGRKVKWDSKTNEFLNDAEANKLATAPAPRDWGKQG